MEVCKIKQQWRKKKAVEPLCKTMHWEMYFKSLLSYWIKITPKRQKQEMFGKMSFGREGIIFCLKGENKSFYLSYFTCILENNYLSRHLVIAKVLRPNSLVCVLL